MSTLYLKLEDILSQGHLFDFVTCWSHWLLFCVCVFFPLAPHSIIAGARLSVLSTSVVGTLILLARGKDTLPLIKERLYVYDQKLIFPFFQSFPVILCIDCLWHGLPMWFVLCSKPLPEANIVPSLLTVGALGGSFLFFEYNVRNIDPGVTYGLKAMPTTTPAVLTGIALFCVNAFPTVVDPENSLGGWRDLFIAVTGTDSGQYLAAATFIAVWYFVVCVYGRLPDGEKTFVELVKDAVNVVLSKRVDIVEIALPPGQQQKQQTKRAAAAKSKVEKEEEEKEEKKDVAAKRRGRSRSRKAARA